MMSTPVRPLGDVLELERIPAEISSDQQYVQIGIRSFGRGIFHREPVYENGLSKLRYFQVHPNRLIVSNIMAWEGAVALSRPEDAGCIASARFLSYRPIGEVDLRYLNYFFRTDRGRSMLADASTGSVKRNQTLSPMNFERLRVPMPDLAEQRRVATRIESAMARFDRIGNLQRSSDRTHLALRESLIANVADPVRYEISSVMTLVRRPVPVDPAGEYREIGIRSFGRGVFHKPVVSGAALGTKRIFAVEPGDLILSSVFAWEGAVARAGEAERGRVGSHRFMTYIVDERVADADYLRFFFLSSGGLDIIRRCSPGGAGRNKTLGMLPFHSEKIPLPPLGEQQRVARILVGTEKVVQSHQPAFESAVDKLRRSLLNSAFSGSL